MGYVKKAVSISVITILAPNVLNADMSNFIQNNLGTSMTSESAGYYKSQVSGFLSGGSTRVRWGGGDNIRPFSLTAPSFNVGCSGIDMVFGGFSYLNFDYLVEKLKKLASAAPAFAFNIALSTLCKDCQTIMTELEKITDAINNMNFDTCQMTTNWSKQIGNMISAETEAGQANGWISKFSSAMEGTAKTIEDWSSRVNNFVNNAQTGDDEKLSSKMLGEGSLLKKAFEKKAAFFKVAFGDDKEYEAIARALMGDVYKFFDRKPTPENKDAGDIKTIVLAPTIEPKNFIDAIYKGENPNNPTGFTFLSYKLEEDKAAGHWKPHKGENYTMKIEQGGMRKKLVDKFRELINKIATQQPLTDDDKAFISSAPLPVADMLNIAATGYNADDTLYEFIALIMFSSFLDEIFNEYVRTISEFYGMDKDFWEGNKEEITQLKNNIYQIRTSIADIIAELKLQENVTEQKLDGIRKALRNSYQINDMFNTSVGK